MKSAFIKIFTYNERNPTRVCSGGSRPSGNWGGGGGGGASPPGSYPGSATGLGNLITGVLTYYHVILTQS